MHALSYSSIQSSGIINVYCSLFVQRLHYRGGIVIVLHRDGIINVQHGGITVVVLSA